MTPGPDGEDDGHGGQKFGTNHELGVDEGVESNAEVEANEEAEIVGTGQTTDALASLTREPTTELNTSRILVTVVRPLSEAQRTVSGNPRWSKS